MNKDVNTRIELLGNILSEMDLDSILSKTLVELLEGEFSGQNMIERTKKLRTDYERN